MPSGAAVIRYDGKRGVEKQEGASRAHQDCVRSDGQLPLDEVRVCVGHYGLLNHERKLEGMVMAKAGHTNMATTRRYLHLAGTVSLLMLRYKPRHF